MTHIICDWLRGEIDYNTSIPVEKAFANGYLLGKLLYKYGAQKDFFLFKESDTLDVILDNFIRLGPTMKHLGIKFTAHDARDIIQGKARAIFTLLYSLYVVLHQVKYRKMEPAQAIPHSGLTLLEDIYYKRQLKKLVPRQADASLAQVTARFEAQRVRNEQQLEYKRLAAAVQQEEAIQARRRKAMERSRQLRLAQAEIMANLQESIDELCKKPPHHIERFEKKQSQSTAVKESWQAIKEIEEFERTIKETAKVATTGGRPNSQSKTTGDRAPTYVTPRKHKDGKFVKINPEETEAYMTQISEKFQQERSAIKERQKRHRHIIISVLEEHQLQQEEKRSQQLAECLLRQSQLERRLLVQLEQVKQEKLVMIANRMERQKEYEARREAEFQAAMDLERERGLQKKREEAGILAVLREIWANHKLRKREAAYKRHYDFVEREVVLLLIAFAIKLAEFRMYTRRLVPATLFRQWKRQFIVGTPFWTEKAHIEQQTEGDAMIPKSAEATTDHEELDELEFTDYRTLSGDWDLTKLGVIETKSLPDDPVNGSHGHPIEWKDSETLSTDCAFPCFDPKEPEDPNPVLHWVIQRLHNMVYQRPPTPAAPSLPEAAVRMAIVGKPLSGKSTVAAELARNQNMTVIDPLQLVQVAVDAIESDDPDTTETEDTKEEHEISELQPEDLLQALGRKIKELLQSGQMVTDELLSVLVFERVRTLPDGTNCVLDGFPTNSKQARLLQQLLTVADALHHLKQQIFKPEHNSEETEGSELSSSKRGLDLIVYLDIPDDEVLKRAAQLSVAERNSIEETEQLDPDAETNGSLSKRLMLGNVEERLEYSHRFMSELQQIFRTDVLHQLQPPSLSVEKDAASENSLPSLYSLVETLVLEKLDAYEKARVGLLDVNPPPDGVETTGDNTRNRDAGALSASPKEPDIPTTEQPTDSIESTAFAPESLPVHEPETAPQPGSPMKSDKTPAKSKPHDIKRTAVDKERSPSHRPPLTEDRKLTGKKRDGVSSHGSQSESRQNRRTGSPTTKPGKGSSKKNVLPKAAPEEVEAGPPSPKPGDQDWIYVDAPLLQDCATILMQFYENSCATYRKNVKAIFAEVRHIRWTIEPHLHHASIQFHNYLQRPDTKQPYVSQFQTSFNSFLDETRMDHEIKSELHCRTDDLRDRLYEIMDEAKLANEEKVQAFINPSDWLTDRLGLLVNCYVTLMQLELTQFQNHVYFLRDYYRTMEGRPHTFEGEHLSVLDGTINCNDAEFGRLPLLKLSEQADAASDAGHSSKTSSRNTGLGHTGDGGSRGAPSRDRSRTTYLSDYSSPAGSDFVEVVPEYKTPIKLIHLKASLNEMYAAMTKSGPGATKQIYTSNSNSSKSKGKQEKTLASNKTTSAEKHHSPNPAVLLIDLCTTPGEPEAHFLFNSYLCALQYISNQYQAEKAYRAAEAEADNSMGMHNAKRPIGKATDEKGGGGKTKGKSKGRKVASTKGAKTDALTSVPSGESQEEENRMRVLRNRIRKEYLAALDKQVSSAVFRLTVIRVQSCAVLTELRRQVKETEQTLNDWIGERTIKEHNALNSMLEIIRNAIETEQRLPQPLVLSGEYFYIEPDTGEKSGTNSPDYLHPSTSTPTSKVSTVTGCFTLEQMQKLLCQFKQLAPSGFIRTDAFRQIIQPIIEERTMELSGSLTPESINEMTSSLARTYGAPMGPENGHPAQPLDSPVDSSAPQGNGRTTIFYVDWRRFMIAAIQTFYPKARTTWSSLLRLSERLYELDQRCEKSQQEAERGLLGVKVTREQFRLAALPWLTNEYGSVDPIRELLFSIFSEPIDSPADYEVCNDAAVKQNVQEDIQMDECDPEAGISSSLDCTQQPGVFAMELLDCAELLLHLSIVDARSGFHGLLRALSCLIKSQLPHNLLDEVQSETTTPEAEEVMPATVPDPMIPKEALQKLLCFGLVVHSDDSSPNGEDTGDEANIIDTLQSGHQFYQESVTELYEQLHVTEEPNENATSPISFSKLVGNPKFMALLRSVQSRFELPEMPQPWPTLLALNVNSGP